MLATEGVEAHDAAEKNGDVVVALGRDGPLVSQFVGYGRRQDGVQQSEKKKKRWKTKSARGEGGASESIVKWTDWIPSFLDGRFYSLTHHLLGHFYMLAAFG